jgi:amino acid adenylation domain-containing protein
MNGSKRTKPTKGKKRAETHELAAQNKIDRPPRALAGQTPAVAAKSAIAESELRTEVIGIYMPPSRHFATAILGIMRAQCAFAPIPLDAPSSWVERIVRTCDIKLVLTTAALAADLKSMVPSVELLLIDDEDDEGDPGADESAVGTGQSASVSSILDRPAYVLHTSGTTGEPKGIAISHNNVLPLLLWQKEVFVADQQLEHLLVLPLTFDFGLQDLLVAILFGGCINMRADGPFDPEAVAKLLREDEISSFYATPAMLETLVSHGPFPSLRVVLSGGEVLGWKLGRSLLAAVDPQARIFNGYGPTEASINCLMFQLNREAMGRQDVANSVPIGYASGASKVLILDIWKQPAALGVSGEIVIGGPGVCDGYIGTEIEQDRRFLKLPFVGATEQFLYRSGDLGRQLANGAIEFLGRIDDQIKIRGFRVEPGEVEAALECLPEIKQAAVLPEPGCERESLIALVTTLGAGPHDASTLRAALARNLPSYLVPRAILFVDLMPVTDNGKLDRAALVNLAKKMIEPFSDRNALRTGSLNAIEGKISRLWRSEFKLNDIDVTSDFFELGGDSLSIARIHPRLCRAVSFDIPIGTLFEYRSITSLAAFLSTLTDEARPSVDPLQERVQRNSARRMEAVAALRN